ncbi:type II toxin-antitoxin system YafQ family toxin [Parachlamydia sp. AcF125]|uniref:type II toxin-antitoxin system YafQ family toxin n=1 Tax=Parachlamydia sp. AcF125 TaxID=2795736 RepID=UPI001BC96AD7|nr:type II toxin-antitoxin system YafQ family toxin [Parachlamydia sp. AcF125]MBS4168427.1 mRNA interferase toxin YafQ [Parachlamydia sp. AcF125]
MLTPINTKQFKKDLKKYEHKKEVLKELKIVMMYILKEEPLPVIYKDHTLTGNWMGRRECHVKNDVLLIYKIFPESREALFERIGSHSELLKM